MKKIKIAVLMLAVIALFTGCGNSSKRTEAKVDSFQTNQESKEVSEESQKNDNVTEEVGSELEETGNRVLIAYFSRIGNIDSKHEVDAISSASVVTQGDNILGNLEYMARLIAQETDGDIHFIQTSEPYPSEYDSSDDNALDVQANQENRDHARPELATHIDNIEDYDTVFLGFPNWYGDMPMAVYSFLDEYDLSGKKIYLFNSSGGSGAANAYSEVSDLEPDSEVEKNILSVSHSRVADLTEQDMQEWLSDIDYQK